MLLPAGAGDVGRGTPLRPRLAAGAKLGGEERGVTPARHPGCSAGRRTGAAKICAGAAAESGATTGMARLRARKSSERAEGAPRGTHEARGRTTGVVISRRNSAGRSLTGWAPLSQLLTANKKRRTRRLVQPARAVQLFCRAPPARKGVQSARPSEQQHNPDGNVSDGERGRRVSVSTKITLDPAATFALALSWNLCAPKPGFMFMFSTNPPFKPRCHSHPHRVAHSLAV